MTFNFLGGLESVANMLGYSDVTALYDDVQAIAKNHTEASADQAVADIATLLKKRATNIPSDTVDACAVVLLSLVTVGYHPSVHNDEIAVAAMIHAAPKFGIKDAPLDDETKQALQNCNSTLDAWSIITMAALKVEGVS